MPVLRDLSTTPPEHVLFIEKEPLRFFRTTFPRRQSKHLISLYYALCMLEDDEVNLCQHWNAFVKTISQNIGVGVETIRPYVDAMYDAGVFKIHKAPPLDHKIYILPWAKVIGERLVIAMGELK